jgi:hypothetical protein
MPAAHLLAYRAQPGVLGAGPCAWEKRLALRPLPRSVSSSSCERSRLAIIAYAQLRVRAGPLPAQR